MFGLIPFRMTRGSGNTITSLTNLFDNFFSDDFISTFDDRNDIRADVRETNEAYLVEAELPGVNKDDLRLDYDNNYLTISAMKNETFEDRQDNYWGKKDIMDKWQEAFILIMLIKIKYKLDSKMEF